MAGHFPILTDPLIVPLHIVTGFTHNPNNWTFQPHHADRSPVLVSHRGPVFCILTFYRPAHGMGFQPGFNIRFPGGLILWFTSSGKPEYYWYQSLPWNLQHLTLSDTAPPTLILFTIK